MQLLTQDELAKLIKRSTKSLERDRARGIGCPYIRVGRQVRYDPEQVREFYKQNTHTNTSEEQIGKGGR